MTATKNIIEVIESLYSTLPPTARTIANYVQQNPLAIVSMPVAELAEVTGTSKATVSRFFRQLGYENHQQAKQGLLDLRLKGLPVVDSQAKSDDQIHDEIDNITKTLTGVSAKQLDEISTLLAKSAKVTIIGYRNAYPLALHFRQQLTQIRTAVQLLPQPGQTIAEDLVDLTTQDLVVLLGFRRRPSGFEKLVESLSGKQVVLLTDPTGQVFNQQVEHLLVCHLGNKQAFDSYGAAMSLISVLCNKTHEKMANKGQIRTTDISKMYVDLQELSNK